MSKAGEPRVPPVGSADLHLAAHMFHPPRLTLARELRQLTKADLAEAIGKSAAAVSQFEGAGRTACKPDPKTLALIALALKVPVGFFARKYPERVLDVEQCHFRSLRSASQRDRRKLVAFGTICCDMLGVLEEYVDLPPEQVTGISRPVRSEEDIERLAAEVRRAWGLGLGPIENVVRLLERQGILVVRIPAGCREVDAFSTWHEGRPLVFLVMDKGSTSRARFDAGHELGHLLMHADASPGNTELERQANRFSSAFLLPKDSFALEFPRYLDWAHLYELKRRWRTSVQAMLRRGYDLQLLSEASYRRAFMHMSRTGERTRERDEPAAEVPSLLRKAFDAASPDLNIEQLAARLGLASQELPEIGTAERGET